MTIQRHSTANDLSRAAQRKQRLLEIENEQRREDAEALKMTEEQHQMLVQSFTSVKAEFSDLDGLSWNAAHPHTLCPSRDARSLNDAFVVLTDADLASFSPHETIRASASRSRTRPGLSPRISCPKGASFSSSSRRYFSGHSPFPVPSSPSSPTSAVQGILGNYKSCRTRSPVKGLFNIVSHDSYNPYTGCMISESDAGSDSLNSQKDGMSRLSAPPGIPTHSLFVDGSSLANPPPSPPAASPLRREPSRVFRHLDSHTSF